MTTVYIITDPENPDLTRITTGDLHFYDPDIETVSVEQTNEPLDLLDDLRLFDLEPGDIICFAGVALRNSIWNLLGIAQEKNLNMMPGQAVDHRNVPIPSGSFYSRRTQESNQHQGIPYVMLIGDPSAAKLSWQTISSFKPLDIWSVYFPDKITIHHWLSAAAFVDPTWLTPSWFAITDLSKRDLDITPTMYSTNHWNDWISFYPAKGNFKLENHTQINPVWFDRSTKPLEYWKHV